MKTAVRKRKSFLTSVILRPLALFAIVIAFRFAIGDASSHGPEAMERNNRFKIHFLKLAPDQQCDLLMHIAMNKIRFDETGERPMPPPPTKSFVDQLIRDIDLTCD